MTNNFKVTVRTIYLTNNNIIGLQFPDNLPNKIKSITEYIVIHHVRKQTKVESTTRSIYMFSEDGISHFFSHEKKLC